MANSLVINTVKALPYAGLLNLLKNEGKRPSYVEHRHKCDHGKLMSVINPRLGLNPSKQHMPPLKG